MLMKRPDAMSPAEIDEGTPVSVKIRERIAAARKRFHANDNIADFHRAPASLKRCSMR
jgi:GTP cyclohydrolase I